MAASLCDEYCVEQQLMMMMDVQADRSLRDDGFLLLLVSMASTEASSALACHGGGDCHRIGQGTSNVPMLCVAKAVFGTHTLPWQCVRVCRQTIASHHHQRCPNSLMRLPNAATDQPVTGEHRQKLAARLFWMAWRGSRC